jgi:hypothetical protein
VPDHQHLNAAFSDVASTVLAWLSPRNQAHIVDESTLHRHCFSAMIGVPSPTFTLNHSSCSLSPSSNLIRLEDVSPAALRNALLPFAHAGTAAFRISLLAAHASSPSSALPFTVKSLIFFARSQLLALCQVSARAPLSSLSCCAVLCCAVDASAQDVLAVASARSHASSSRGVAHSLPGHGHFRSHVSPDDWADITPSHSINAAFSGIMHGTHDHAPSLLQLLAHTASLRRHLLLVASFCYCNPENGIDSWSPAVAAEQLGGHGLVDNLVYRSLSCVGQDLVLVHSFLQAAFQPVLDDIARWVFCGEADDATAGGGVIQLNSLVEEGKWGRRAWDACVFVDIAQVPHMLAWQQFVYMVTVTGKSTRLLTKHAPDHFLAGGVPGSIPTLHFHIDSELQLRNADYACRTRSLFMERESKYNSVVAAAASAAAAAKRRKIIEIRERRAKIEEVERQRILTRRQQGSS